MSLMKNYTCYVIVVNFIVVVWFSVWYPNFLHFIEGFQIVHWHILDIEKYDYKQNQIQCLIWYRGIHQINHMKIIKFRCLEQEIIEEREGETYINYRERGLRDFRQYECHDKHFIHCLYTKMPFVLHVIVQELEITIAQLEKLKLFLS